MPRSGAVEKIFVSRQVDFQVLGLGHTQRFHNVRPSSIRLEEIRPFAAMKLQARALAREELVNQFGVGIDQHRRPEERTPF